MSDRCTPAIANARSAARAIGVRIRSSAYVGVLNRMCSPNPLIHTGRCRDRRATSALAMSTPAPPCTRITVSSMWIGSAITGLFSTSSTVIGLPWNTAPGWAHAFSR